jgi:hypothetical protein
MALFHPWRGAARPAWLSVDARSAAANVGATDHDRQHSSMPFPAAFGDENYRSAAANGILFFGETDMLGKYRDGGDNLLIFPYYGRPFPLTGGAVRPDST